MQSISNDMEENAWDNYQLSAEVIAMAPQKRKKVYGDYDAELMSVLEEKNKQAMSLG